MQLLEGRINNQILGVQGLKKSSYTTEQQFCKELINKGEKPNGADWTTEKNLNFFVNPFFGEILPVSLSEGPNFWVAFQHKD